MGHPKLYVSPEEKVLAARRYRAKYYAKYVLANLRACTFRSDQYYTPGIEPQLTGTALKNERKLGWSIRWPFVLLTDGPLEIQRNARLFNP